MYWLIVLLLALLFYNLWKKEGYENYDEPSCLMLAKKNQSNLDSLKKDVEAILALQTKVQTLQNTTDANSKQLKSLVDQVYKT
jgi:Tfp pilus assembly protein PilN